MSFGCLKATHRIHPCIYECVQACMHTRIAHTRTCVHTIRTVPCEHHYVSCSFGVSLPARASAVLLKDRNRHCDDTRTETYLAIAAFADGKIIASRINDLRTCDQQLERKGAAHLGPISVSACLNRLVRSHHIRVSELDSSGLSMRKPSP